MRALPLLDATTAAGAARQPGAALPEDVRSAARRSIAAHCQAGAAGGGPACSAPEEPALVAHGWSRRFVGDGRMIEEAVALYTRLGYEVMAIPLDTAPVEEPCSGCAVSLRSFSVLYTRSPAGHRTSTRSTEDSKKIRSLPPSASR